MPSIYLHPADSVHGDLGIVRKEDIFFIISNSGETEEVIKILPWIKRMGMVTIVVTGNRASTIARHGDIVLDVRVEEACPYNLIPTSSTTTTLALGDALAVALMKERNFTSGRPGAPPPGGQHRQEPDPQGGGPDAYGGGVAPAFTRKCRCGRRSWKSRRKGSGMTGVFNSQDELVGYNHRRRPPEGLRKYENMLSIRAEDVMARNPKGIEKDALAARALKEMEEYSITSLFVFEGDEQKHPIGVLHIHDLLKAKIVLSPCGLSDPHT